MIFTVLPQRRKMRCGFAAPVSQSGHQNPVHLDRVMGGAPAFLLEHELFRKPVPTFRDHVEPMPNLCHLEVFSFAANPFSVSLGWGAVSPALRGPMPDENYLRKQADVCHRLSQTCFDLTVAAHLRAMAEEFAAKAQELERSGNYARKPAWRRFLPAR